MAEGPPETLKNTIHNLNACPKKTEENKDNTRSGLSLQRIKCNDRHPGISENKLAVVKNFNLITGRRI